MKIDEIKKKAKKIGIKTEKMNKINKTELVRAIQRAEGNFDCFRAGKENCDQFGCCWREDCFKKI